jgi:hypothetical protein
MQKSGLGIKTTAMKLVAIVFQGDFSDVIFAYTSE